MKSLLVFSHCIFIALFVFGCMPAMKPEKTGSVFPVFEPVDNELLNIASEAVLAAREAGFEWLIADPVAADKTVTFSQLLGIAKELASRGETNAAEQLAERLIRLSKLALEQAEKAKAAQPDYPFVD